MCYSAQASFIAAGYLVTLGTLCLKKNKLKKATLFAAIPILFALQQLSEGFLWLSFAHNWPTIQHYAPYLFLFFAFFIWPIYIPSSVGLIETHTFRRKNLILLAMLGIIVSLYLFSYITLYGVAAQALGCHIFYDVDMPTSTDIIGTILYLMCTILPFFVSSIRNMTTFGFMLLISYIISYQFYFNSLISIWCFFAAILSGLVYVIILQLNKEPS